jgi:peptide/nickel transport system substrate-binding protein
VSFQHLEIRVDSGGHTALRGKQGKLVRRALAYGINRVGIVRALFGEIDPKLRPLDSNVFLAQSPFYEPNWRIYRYRPEEARRLLQQSGCRQGADGIYVCKGQKLSLILFTTAGNVGRERIAQLVQAQLRRVGIEVIPRYAPAVILFDQILPSGNWDLALFGYAYGPDPYGRDEFFGCGGSDNWTGYCQRLVTRDLDQADRILDQVHQARVLNRADAQMARDVPVIPLLQGRLAAYRRSNIRNFVMSFPTDYWKAENWWLAR